MVHARKTKIKGEVFEMSDIFDDLNQKNIEKNIEYILRRKKIWSPKFEVVIPVGGMVNVTDDFYQYDFEIFTSPNKMKYVGTAYGLVMDEEIIDMNVELKEVK